MSTLGPLGRDTPLVGTNWKMMLTPSEAGVYLETLIRLLHDVSDRRVFVLPSHPALAAASEILAGSQISWGAQDVHPQDRGAYTGEVSAPMLADLGCSYVMVGHFERRRDRGETDDQVRAKVDAVRRSEMIALVCVGETERLPIADALRFVSAQVRSLGDPGDGQLVLAYEPGWAIGAQGTPAPTVWFADMHDGLRDTLATISGDASEVPIISGGSVTLATGRELLAQPSVDGLFVGRDALDPHSFSAIVHAQPAA